VVKVLGSYTYELTDHQVWNARKLRRFHPPEEMPSYTELCEEPPLPRRSARTTKGVAPDRLQAGSEEGEG
jgi:hypothetical protein